MIELKSITHSIKDRALRITDHADEEAYNDGVSLTEALNPISSGEIIEQYPDDKPYPSCLVYSKLENNNPLHTVWAFNQATKSSVLIPIYHPDPRRWIDGKIRTTP